MLQTSVLYDGRAAATPSQLRELSLRDARIDRIKALALPDRPIACLSASERASIVVEMPKKQIHPAGLTFCAEYILHPESMLWCHDLVKHAFDEPAQRKRASRYPRIEEIIEACGTHWNVGRVDMKSARRTANVVRPRQVAMYLAKKLTLKSLPEIGRHFGRRDHTTVLHAVRKITALVVTDLMLAAECAEIENQLKDR